MDNLPLSNANSAQANDQELRSAIITIKDILVHQEKAREEGDKDTKRNVICVIAVFIASLDVALLSYVRDAVDTGDTASSTTDSTSADVVFGCLFISIVLALIPAFLTTVLSHKGVSEWTSSVWTYYVGVLTFNSSKMRKAIYKDIVQRDADRPTSQHGYVAMLFIGNIMLWLSLIVKLGWFTLFLLPSVIVLVSGVLIFVWDKQATGVGIATTATILYGILAIVSFGIISLIRRKFKTVIR